MPEKTRAPTYRTLLCVVHTLMYGPRVEFTAPTRGSRCGHRSKRENHGCVNQEFLHVQNLFHVVVYCGVLKAALMANRRNHPKP